MKKVLGFIAVLSLAALPVLADTTNTYTNAVGQVFVVVVGANGAVAGVGVVPTQPAAGTTLITGTPNVFLAAKGAATTTSAHTPTKPGDILVGELLNSTNAVWIACGVTGASWVKVSND